MIYLYNDLETTGLLRHDRAISAGFVFGNYNPEEKTMTYINSDELYNNTTVRMSPKSIHKHGITPELLIELSEGKTAYDNAKIILDYIMLADRILGYNYSFDMGMMKNTYGIDIKEIPKFQNQIFDVMSSVRNVFGTRMQLELAVESTIEYCNLPKDEYDKYFMEKVSKGNCRFHTALYDAYVTARIHCDLNNIRWI